MYAEPSVPFYMALSVYVPLFVLAFFAVYGTLRLVFCSLRRLGCIWNERGPGAFGAHDMRLPPAPHSA